MSNPSQNGLRVMHDNDDDNHGNKEHLSARERQHRIHYSRIKSAAIAASYRLMHVSTDNVLVRKTANAAVNGMRPKYLKTAEEYKQQFEPDVVESEMYNHKSSNQPIVELCLIQEPRRNRDDLKAPSGFEFVLPSSLASETKPKPILCGSGERYYLCVRRRQATHERAITDIQVTFKSTIPLGYEPLNHLHDGTELPYFERKPDESENDNKNSSNANKNNVSGTASNAHQQSTHAHAHAHTGANAVSSNNNSKEHTVKLNGHSLAPNAAHTHASNTSHRPLNDVRATSASASASSSSTAASTNKSSKLNPNASNSGGGAPDLPPQNASAALAERGDQLSFDSVPLIIFSRTGGSDIIDVQLKELGTKLREGLIYLDRSLDDNECNLNKALDEEMHPIYIAYANDLIAYRFSPSDLNRHINLKYLTPLLISLHLRKVDLAMTAIESLKYLLLSNFIRFRDHSIMVLALHRICAAVSNSVVTWNSHYHAKVMELQIIICQKFIHHLPGICLWRMLVASAIPLKFDMPKKFLKKYIETSINYIRILAFGESFINGSVKKKHRHSLYVEVHQNQQQQQQHESRHRDRHQPQHHHQQHHAPSPSRDRDRDRGKSPSRSHSSSSRPPPLGGAVDQDMRLTPGRNSQRGNDDQQATHSYPDMHACADEYKHSAPKTHHHHHKQKHQKQKPKQQKQSFLFGCMKNFVLDLVSKTTDKARAEKALIGLYQTDSFSSKATEYVSVCCDALFITDYEKPWTPLGCMIVYLCRIALSPRVARNQTVSRLRERSFRYCTRLLERLLDQICDAEYVRRMPASFKYLCRRTLSRTICYNLCNENYDRYEDIFNANLRFFEKMCIHWYSFCQHEIGVILTQIILPKVMERFTPFRRRQKFLSCVSKILQHDKTIIALVYSLDVMHGTRAIHGIVDALMGILVETASILKHDKPTFAIADKSAKSYTNNYNLHHLAIQSLTFLYKSYSNWINAEIINRDFSSNYLSQCVLDAVNGGFCEQQWQRVMHKQTMNLRAKELACNTDEDKAIRNAVRLLLSHKYMAQNAVLIAEWLHQYRHDIPASNMGDYLGGTRPKEERALEEGVRQCYIKQCRLNFHAPIEIVMQFFLTKCGFRMPAEAQKIERILESFAAVYFEARSEIWSSPDAVFVVFNAILMLNTSLHNPRIKDKDKLKKSVFLSMCMNVRGQLSTQQDYERVYDYIEVNAYEISFEDEDKQANKIRQFDEWKRKSLQSGRRPLVAYTQELKKEMKKLQFGGGGGGSHRHTSHQLQALVALNPFDRSHSVNNPAGRQQSPPSHNKHTHKNFQRHKTNTMTAIPSYSTTPTTTSVVPVPSSPLNADMDDRGGDDERYMIQMQDTVHITPGRGGGADEEEPSMVMMMDEDVLYFDEDYGGGGGADTPHAPKTRYHQQRSQYNKQAQHRHHGQHQQQQLSMQHRGHQYSNGFVQGTPTSSVRNLTDVHSDGDDDDEEDEKNLDDEQKEFERQMRQRFEQHSAANLNEDAAEYSAFCEEIQSKAFWWLHAVATHKSNLSVCENSVELGCLLIENWWSRILDALKIVFEIPDDPYTTPLVLTILPHFLQIALCFGALGHETCKVAFNAVLSRYKTWWLAAIKHIKINNPSLAKESDLTAIESKIWHKPQRNYEKLKKYIIESQQIVHERTIWQRLRDLQFEFSDVNFMLKGREFIGEQDILKMGTRDTTYRLFFFNDMLLYATGRPGKYRSHRVLMLIFCALEEIKDSKNVRYAFRILSPQKSITIALPNSDYKRICFKKINELIVKQRRKLRHLLDVLKKKHQQHMGDGVGGDKYLKLAERFQTSSAFLHQSIETIENSEKRNVSAECCKLCLVAFNKIARRKKECPICNDFVCTRCITQKAKEKKSQKRRNVCDGCLDIVEGRLRL